MTLTDWGGTRIIAEAGTCNHDIDWALDAAARAALAGAWGFKVQMLSPETLTSRTAAPYSRGLAEPGSQWDAFEHALPYAAWREVKAFCDDIGIVFFASCWDHAAVDEAAAMGVTWFKIGSADITYESLVRYVGDTGVPVMLSTGGAEPDEIWAALDWLGDSRVVPMVCTLAYPCPASEAHLRRLRFWSDQGYEVGYSDHTRGLDTMLVAAQLGADFVEKHFTVTPGRGGDHDFGITPDQLEWVCDRIPAVYGSGGPARSPLLGSGGIGRLDVEIPAVAGARRSWHTELPQVAGEPFGLNVVALRPGTGIPPSQRSGERLFSTLARRDYGAGEMIDPDELG